MESSYVSTPAWTCRVDVRGGVIQSTTARYLQSAYGQTCATWQHVMQRRYGVGVRIVRLHYPPWWRLGSSGPRQRHPGS